MNKKPTICVKQYEIETKNIRPVVSPIHPSTSYEFPNNSDEVFYPRSFNTPSQISVAKKISDLEGGEQGLVLASGMAAISSALLALLSNGDHIIFFAELYGGTQSFVTSEFAKYGIDFSYIYDSNISAFEKAIKPTTKVIYVETPSNPLLNIIDLKALSTLAQKHNLITVIDNTFATPINQNPISFGVDVVVHSGTKYLNGHSDVNCGAIITSTQLMKIIEPVASLHGATLDSHACYLLERGLKTLALRVERQNYNAAEIAHYLVSGGHAEEVFYPGLKSHKNHEIAVKQMYDFGGMVSFKLKYSQKKVLECIKCLKIFHPATSLGGIESLICLPSLTSQRKMDKQMQVKLGISESLIRLSVGIEDIDDLKGDLEQAFFS